MCNNLPKTVYWVFSGITHMFATINADQLSGFAPNESFPKMRDYIWESPGKLA